MSNNCAVIFLNCNRSYNDGRECKEAKKVINMQIYVFLQRQLLPAESKLRN